MQCDHQGWRPRLRLHSRAQHLGSATQNGKSPFPGFTQFRTGPKRDTGFEHRGVVGGLGPCEFKIGLAQPIKCRKRLRPAAIPGFLEHNRELLEAAQRDAREEFIAVAEMAIRCGRADTRPPRSLGKGKARWSFLRDQFQRGAEQRLFQVAGVVAARATAPLVFRPAHVNSFYMSRYIRSMRRRGVASLPASMFALPRWWRQPANRRRLQLA